MLRSRRWFRTGGIVDDRTHLDRRRFGRRCVEEFFTNAEELSGQDIGKVKARPADGYDIPSMGWADNDTSFAKRLVVALDEARLGPGAGSGKSNHLEVAKAWEDLSSLFSLGSAFWEHWNDKSGEAAKEQFNRVHQWFSMDSAQGVFRQQALAHLAAVVATFAMAIQAARVSLDNLMHQLVQEINGWNGKPAGHLPVRANLAHQVDDLTNQLDKVRYFRSSVQTPWPAPNRSAPADPRTPGAT